MSNSPGSGPALPHQRPKFTRSTGHRSRGGCRTCKQRHIKCDESRPTCSKCDKKGLVCDGYPQSLKWSHRHQLTASEAARHRQQPQASEAPVAVADAVATPAPEVDSSPQRGHRNGVGQPGGEAGGQPGLEADPFSPSYLLGFDCLDSVDQAFGGNFDLASTNIPVHVPDFANSGWPLDLSMGEPSRFNSMPCPDLELVRTIPVEPFGGSADSATRLIKTWFTEVCPVWSGFDSPTNMNRKLAEDLWHRSSPVFTALQSMSASFLSARLPQMRRPALSLLRTATLCVQGEMEELHRKEHLDTVPAGIIFSLLCLGTTICWLDARRVGWPFLQDAKRLLRRTSQQNLASKAETVNFFNKSLVYWDMLISFVYDPEPGTDVDEVNIIPPISTSLVDPGDPTFDLEPHPWTGISLQTSRLFTRSMRICRNHRRRIAELSRGAITPAPAFLELEQAKKLEGELLQLQFSPCPPVKDTGDQRTPGLHLLHLAEAYQLASLLQLYMQFPVLLSLRLPEESRHLYEGDPAAAWNKWIIPLTIQLTEVLERIPPESGSRVMQPLLYVCAATGLRYGAAPRSGGDGIGFGAPGFRGCQLKSRPMESILDYLGLLNDPVERSEEDEDPLSVSQLALDVSKARAFILRRLSVLKECLHPGPISTAVQLVKAVWAAYDEEPRGSTDVCWIEIMDKKDLQTMFG